VVIVEVFEGVDCPCGYDFLWQGVPIVDHSVGKEVVTGRAVFD